MLSDDDSINDINPFVTREFSLPGGVRQTGNFDDFEEIKKSVNVPFKEEGSVFCNEGLCSTQMKPCKMDKVIHPRRNIDCGFTNWEKREITVGVSNRSIPYFQIFLFIFIISLVLLYVKRR